MSKRRELVVNGYSEGWLRKGFPWVYPKEVVRGGGKAASEVTVVSQRGDVLGRALTDDGWLAARVFRSESRPLDDDWLFETLDRAAALRDVVVDPKTTGYRLCHGENDGLPGVRVDWWDHFAVIILDSPAVGSLVPGVVRWLESRRKPRGVYLCYRFDDRDRDRTETLDPAPGWVAGKAPSGPITVQERGISFRVYPGEGPHVGLYADMRDVRTWLEPHWGGRRVLNTFAFTGAFSVAAAMNGASEVVTVDLSSRYIERAEDNFRANDLDPAMHTFLVEDTFKALDRLRRTGELFDAIILDPPSYSHSKDGTWSAKKDYPRLVAAAARVLAPDGWLLCASNLNQASPKDFRGWVAKGLGKAERHGQELLWAGQASDFPAAHWFPEARHLKVGVWRLW